MQNNEPVVELTTEPHVETRFGFQKAAQTASSKVIKISIYGAGLCLAGVLVMRSPEKVESTSNVKTPESSQLSQTHEINFDQYSATQENERIKDQNKKRGASVVIRLPGLQKIDRKWAGQIPPGSMIRAVLVTGASNGSVRAEAKDSLRVQGETLIPQGAVLLGSGQSTEERLFIKFTKLVFKDGTSQDIQAQAADPEDKTVGLKGSKVGRYALKYAAAVGLNFASGMAERLQEKEVINQQVVTKSDVKNALLHGGSKAAIEMANETMTDLKNSTPIIQVEAGKEILLVFESAQ